MTAGSSPSSTTFQHLNGPTLDKVSHVTISTRQRQAGRDFTDEETRWLEMIRDHIAASMIGYMQILQGTMTGIRNPRAHEHAYLDEPHNALEILALCNHVVRIVRRATRTKKSKKT